jgi:hypothetical protein
MYKYVLNQLLLGIKFLIRNCLVTCGAPLVARMLVMFRVRLLT